MDSGSTRLHVVPSLSGGWVVRESADGPALRRSTTRRGALGFATDVLFRARGGDIHVHEADGTVVETYRVAARGPRPWWYAPPRLISLILGAFFMVDGVVNLRLRDQLVPWIGWVMLVTGTLQVASFVVSRAADQRFEAEQERLRQSSRAGGEGLDQG
jgi:hypothetical protein